MQLLKMKEKMIKHTNTPHRLNEVYSETNKKKILLVLKSPRGYPWYLPQWERIHLPMPETGVWSLIQKDRACTEQRNPCAETTKPALSSLGATTAEPTRCSHRRLRAPEPVLLQREKPPQWDAQAPQLETGPSSPQLGKSPHNEGPAQSKISKHINKIRDRNVK